MTDRARVEELQGRLAAAVQAVQSGEDWRRMLDFASRFHRYSLNNQPLIRLAHDAAHRTGLVSAPAPSYVAGFRTWRLLGRTVDKGQHGYAILAPVPRTVRVAVHGSGPDAARRPLPPGEDPRPGEWADTEKRLGWKIEHVFDVSQTSGTPIPQPARPQPLQGAAPTGLIDGLTRFAESRGYTVGYVGSATEIGGADGVTRFDTRTVTLRGDMAPAGIASTLAHEVGHMLLHDPTRDPDGAVVHRGIGEVEAESVAYIVAAAHGMDTGPDSLPYVMHWAGTSTPAEVVQATAQRVVRAAHEVLTALDTTQLGDGAPPGLDEALTAQRRHADLDTTLGTTPAVDVAIGA
jgi:hypothetical protein